MLYDQALAILTYTEAFGATRKERFRETAEEIISYVLRDLQSPGGAIFSAEDADSEGEEGKFYTWTAAELDEVLDMEDAAVAREIYNASDAGNFHTETGQMKGLNILYLKPGVDDPGGLNDSISRELDDTLRRIREKLMAARDTRIRPLRDDKVMIDWNGLMIAALARAAWVYQERSYTLAAERIFEDIAGDWMNGIEGNGELFHIRYQENETIPAFLDDHAYLTWGALELYQVTHRPVYLRAALKAADEMVKFFKDTENGGFYLTRLEEGSEDLRLKPSFDGPMPSGNAVAAMSLLRLGRLTGRPDLEEEAHRTFGAFAADMGANPAAYTHMITAFETAQHGTAEVIIVGDPEDDHTRRFLSALQGSYLPNVIVGLVDPGDPDGAIRELIPYAADMKTLDGKAAAYVCRDFACLAPTTDPEEMLRALLGTKVPGP